MKVSVLRISQNLRFHIDEHICRSLSVCIFTGLSPDITYRCTHGCTHQYTDGRTHRCMDGRTHGWTHTRMRMKTHHTYTYAQQMNIHTQHSHTDAHTDAWMDARTDSRMHIQTRHTYTYAHTDEHTHAPFAYRCTHGWTYARTIRIRMHTQINVRTHHSNTDAHTDDYTHAPFAYRCTKDGHTQHTDACTDACTDAWMDARTDACTDACTDEHARMNMTDENLRANHSHKKVVFVLIIIFNINQGERYNENLV